MHWKEDFNYDCLSGGIAAVSCSAVRRGRIVDLVTGKPGSAWHGCMAWCLGWVYCFFWRKSWVFLRKSCFLGE